MYFSEGTLKSLDVGNTFESDEETAQFWGQAAAVVPVEDFMIPGDDGVSRKARLYRGQSDKPTLVLIHGGGWAGGSIELNEVCASNLAHLSGWNVFALSYRFAPDHPYPAGLNDCVSGFNWLKSNVSSIGVDVNRLGLGGDSAGANLAMALAQRLSIESLNALLLFYGVFGANFETSSYRKYQNGPGLSRENMLEYFDWYDPGKTRDNDPFIAPVLADSLGSLPPALLIAAEHDVLLDDSRNLADRMFAAGHNAELHIEPGVLHGFINHGRLVPAAHDCLERAAAFLRNIG